MKLKKVAITDAQIKKMLAIAKEAKSNTYPEPGKYAVAVLTPAGNIYPGISYLSDTYTLTMHSEATALAHAAIHGEKDVIAITGPNCHICKQLIWESALRSGFDIEVIAEHDDGAYDLVPISQQMPYPWPAEDGQH